MAKQTKKPAADAADEAPPSFEEALAALESLVQEMEGGELSLEESLAAYERGVKLTRQCQAALAAADLKVRELMTDDRLEDLPVDPIDDD